MALYLISSLLKTLSMSIYKFSIDLNEYVNFFNNIKDFLRTASDDIFYEKNGIKMSIKPEHKSTFSRVLEKTPNIKKVIDTQAEFYSVIISVGQMLSSLALILYGLWYARNRPDIGEQVETKLKNIWRSNLNVPRLNSFYKDKSTPEIKKDLIRRIEKTIKLIEESQS